jgi:hypothetical protein
MNHFTRRRFLQSSLASTAAVAMSGQTLANTTKANDVNLGFISCGNRATQLMKAFSRIEGVNIVGLCDPDKNKLDKVGARFPKAKKWQDLRGLLKDDSINAVVVATCNHWHCLAAIWAMEAGKDVYVEKPLSHSQWEGQQTVNAARRYKKVCQVGTQQRSDPMQAKIKKFLHEEKTLGEIVSARVNRYGVRGQIGKRDTPLEIEKNIAYDMWLGPAQDEPLFRDKLHYDWHWDWNTGSGEMGNWGVHVLDDVRNNVFLDKVILPKRILGGGGRVAWGDAGNTPNVHFVYFDTGMAPVVIGLSNLKSAPNGKGSPKHPGPGSGYIAYCEGGRFEGQRGKGVAYDNDGKEIKKFKGDSGMGHHQQNFIDAVRAEDSSILNTDVAVGNASTGWCNLANIAVRSGGPFTPERAAAVTGDGGIWKNLLHEMDHHLGAHAVKTSDESIKLSSMLTIDVENGVFVGENADSANKFLKREYREGFVVPGFELAAV